MQTRLQARWWIRLIGVATLLTACTRTSLGQSTSLPALPSTVQPPDAATTSVQELAERLQKMEEMNKKLADQLERSTREHDEPHEDAEFLSRREALPLERIIGVQTGGCPHTAIRDDASANLSAVANFQRQIPGLELVLIESGGDNLTAVFSRELADRFIFVIDVAEGDKIPRKGGPGICNSDLLVINKTDLAPHVEADLDVMRRDSLKMRGERPFLMVSLRKKEGVEEVIRWVREQLASGAKSS